MNGVLASKSYSIKRREFLFQSLNVAQFFLVYIYIYINLYMFRVTVPIIRRNNCVYVTLGTCYYVCMTVRYADSHPRGITSTKCHMNTVVSADDGHIVARNM
jgi:hypothetical protein